MPPTKANANAADDDADDRRPEREEERQARTDRIWVGIRPQADGSRDDDEYERTRANEEQAETDSDQTGLKIWSHAACVASRNVKHVNGVASSMRGGSAPHPAVRFNAWLRGTRTSTLAIHGSMRLVVRGLHEHYIPYRLRRLVDRLGSGSCGGLHQRCGWKCHVRKRAVCHGSIRQGVVCPAGRRSDARPIWGCQMRRGILRHGQRWRHQVFQNAGWRRGD